MMSTQDILLEHNRVLIETNLLYKSRIIALEFERTEYEKERSILEEKIKLYETLMTNL